MFKCESFSEAPIETHAVSIHNVVPWVIAIGYEVQLTKFAKLAQIYKQYRSRVIYSSVFDKCVCVCLLSVHVYTTRCHKISQCAVKNLNTRECIFVDLSSQKLMGCDSLMEITTYISRHGKNVWEAAVQYIVRQNGHWVAQLGEN